MGGYTKIVEKMLEGADVQLDTDYFAFIKEESRMWREDHIYRYDR